MCRLLGVSKQAYYKHEDHLMKRLALESFVVEFVKDVRKKDPGIGGNKLWLMYTQCFGQENRVGYNRFYDIIEQYGLKVRKRRRRVSTTDSRHGLPLYPNLVKDLIPTRPRQLYVSDITYIPLWSNSTDGENKFCYLSLVTDYYTKEIVGYSVGETLETCHTLEALDMALGHCSKEELHNLIHHSDRGVQYASYAYTDRLKLAGVSISMTECGNPKDNAVAERVNNTIKNELFKGMEFHSIGEVRQALKVAVDFYNNERPHWSLDGMTPAQACQMKGEIQKKWTSFREIAIKKMQI